MLTRAFHGRAENFQSLAKLYWSLATPKERLSSFAADRLSGLPKRPNWASWLVEAASKRLAGAKRISEEIDKYALLSFCLQYSQHILNFGPAADIRWNVMVSNLIDIILLSGWEIFVMLVKKLILLLLADDSCPFHFSFSGGTLICATVPWCLSFCFIMKENEMISTLN